MDGPLLSIDLDRGRPIVAQLVAALRRGILTGALRADDPVPSTRSLATELGVSRSSVVAAYDQLAGEGYLEQRQGAATRVAAVPSAGRRAADEVSALVDGSPSHDTVAALPTRPADGAAAIDLTPGRPSTARLDQRAWRAAWRAAAASVVPSDPPPPFGLPALRDQLADHLRQARGITCAGRDVVITGGTSEGLGLLALALRDRLGRAPRIAVEDPGYPGGRRALQRHGATLLPLRVGVDGLDVAALRAVGRLDAVMVTPSHQYPIGGRLPIADRIALLDWAREHDAIVIEDDYDSEFRHTGAPLPALASLDTDRVVLVGSFSKVLTPRLRLGHLVLPADAALRAAVESARVDIATPVAGPVQVAMAALIESGALRRHIAAARRDYAHRRRLVIDALEALPGTRLIALAGGLHAVLEFESESASESAPADPGAETQAVQALETGGIAVARLSDYALDPDLPDTRRGLVIGYAAVGDAQLVAALGRVRDVVRATLDLGAVGPLG
ncbi:PLP-dependent aminotransferase family protein [Agromyces intestinalis]|uniref:PLP-dependent aminotransferase family protein n=1 Tax=Agromyces intestinalis TaxID=2592652 RepID=A0A5C1YH07_9MICO|nr:PLP-dependent aminotransferase family protein [Agromyces intestinalis]QEO14379.1 PLP-dependent aminotransferase family protein [Agromyces intestinalis]